MKKITLAFAAIILIVPLLASANYGHFQKDNGHQHNHGKTPPVVIPSPVPTPVAPPPTVQPPTTTPTPPSSATGEVRFVAYTTGYAALDNTPRGSTQIDLGGHSGNAGGTGTYSDPITLAVGHSIINGNDIGDYPYGTKFYVPNLRKYFTAADTCGDGNQPQNGPCHSGYNGHVWLDLYVGGSLQSGVLSCEDGITDLHLVIQNPASNYSVVPGAVYDTGCKQYGDTVVSL